MIHLYHVSECSSTQEAVESFLTGEPQRAVAVHTFDQTHGKGQYGNRWQMQKNTSLAYSLAIPVDQLTLPDHLFNFHTANLLADFVDTLTHQQCAIKWPNDLILKNKKIAGLLLEKKISAGQPYLIVGIGLNVRQQNFPDLSKAGSLRTQTGIDYSLPQLTSDLHDFLTRQLFTNSDPKEVLEKLNVRLFRKNCIAVFDINQVRQNGIIKEVDEAGYLWVELEKDGLRKFFHKEITLLY